MPDGCIVFCDGNTGELLQWKDEPAEHVRAHGRLPVGRGARHRRRHLRHPGWQRPRQPRPERGARHPARQPRRHIELLTTAIAGHRLAGPNDLAFGPDGRLWFTESGTEQDDRDPDPQPGRLYVLSADGSGEMLAERPGVYPNGIAFDGQQRMYWTESAAHRVCRSGRGQATVFCQLSDGHVPDGMAFAADGRRSCARPSPAASP